MAATYFLIDKETGNKDKQLFAWPEKIQPVFCGPTYRQAGKDGLVSLVKNR